MMYRIRGTAVILSRHTTIFTADAKAFLKNSKAKLNSVVNMHKDFDRICAKSKTHLIDIINKRC